MLLGPFQPPNPENRIFLRYALEFGIDRAYEVELLFAPPAFELFFASDGKM
jgi:hypothetical protein